MSTSLSRTPIAEHAFGSGALKVSKYLLSNGLAVLVVVDRAAPIVAYQTWLKVGSRHEFAGKTGLAHFFEHLMFNQTEHLAPGEFDRKLESVGADTNAATWLDWTYYKENVPSPHLDLVMSLEADRMGHLVVQDPQVTSEREVVASERRAHVEDDVEGFLAEQLCKIAFDDHHPYRWPTIGWMEDIRGFTTADARGFYETYYAPNNATIVMVGDLDADAALDALERHYGSLPARVIPVQRATPVIAQDGERRETFAKEVSSDRLLVGWHGCSLADPAHAALTVAIDILAGSNSSRLHRLLVVEKEICSSVGMMAPEFRDAGLVELRVSLMHGHRAAAAESLVYETIAELAASGPTPAELARAHTRLETDFWHGLRHPEGKARTLGHWETTVGDFRRMFEAAAGIARVTAEDVQKAADRFFAERRRTVVIAEPLTHRRGKGGRA